MTAAATNPAAPHPGDAHPPRTAAAELIAWAQRLYNRARLHLLIGALSAASLTGATMAIAIAIITEHSHILDGQWRWLTAATGAATVFSVLAPWALERRKISPRHTPKRAQSARDLAAWCASQATAEHREAVRIAVELATPARQSNGSPQLTALAVQAGAPGLKAIDAALQTDGRRVAALAALVAAVIAAVWFITPLDTWQRLRHPPAPPLPAARSVGTLVVDLQLHATPPAYANSQITTGADGEATVLRGSVIEVQGRPIAGVHGLRVEVRRGEQPQPRSQPQPRPERTRRLRLSKGLIHWRSPVDARLRYRFRATASDGATVVEHTWRAIDVRPDAAPVASLRAPTGELEVHAGDEVVLEGVAKDDIGLSHVGVAIALPSGQVRRRAVAITAGDLRVELREALAIDSLKLAPGDLATVWLEATDNNARDGQRRGASDRVTLRMFSPERYHARLLAEIAALALRWTLRLADRLEGSPVRSTAKLDTLIAHRTAFVASENADLRRLSRLRGRIAEDVLARGRSAAELTDIGRRLRHRIADEGRTIARVKRAATGLGARIERGRVVRMHGRVVGSQERAVIRMAALAAAEHRAAMLRDSEALTALERRLTDVLNALKRRPDDPALRAKAERLLDAIEARMARISASAARQLKLTPPTHVNDGASDARGMQASLRQHTTTLADVRAKLRSGDISGALKALRQGRTALSVPLTALRDAAAKERSAEDAALERLVAALLRGITLAERGEETLQREVEPSASAQRVAAANLLRRQLQATAPQVEHLLDDARDQVRPKRLRSYQLRNSRPLARGRAALSIAQQAMGRADIDEALQALLEAREQLAAATKADGDGSEAVTRARDIDRVRTALDRSARAAALLRELLPSPRTLHTPATQRALAGKVNQQNRLRRKLDRVRRKLDRHGHAHPALRRQVGARLAHGSGMMRQVAVALGESDARRAHDQMTEVRSALADAKRLLSRLKNGPKDGSGVAGAGQRAAGGQRRRRGDGERGGDVGRGAAGPMRLKSGNRNDSGEDFRREVLKAMRRRAPAGYDARLRRYYQGLTEAP